MLRSFITLALVAITASSAQAQYGPVDLDEAATRILRTSLAEESTGGSAFITLNAYKPFGWEKGLRVLLTHPIPEIRIRAAIELGRNGDVLEAMRLLPTEAERTTTARSLLVDGNLSVADAEALLAGGDLEPTLEAMLYGIDRKRTGKPLEAMMENKTIALFARGIAASNLRERGNNAALQDWHDEVLQLPESAGNELLYELSTLAAQLKNTHTLQWLATLTTERPANDLLRLTTTTGLLRTNTASGLQEWRAQFNDAKHETLHAPLAGVLLSLGLKAPDDAMKTLAAGPPLHKKLAAILRHPPEERLAAVDPLIEHGHRPTMQWAVLEAAQQDSPAATAALQAILSHLSTNGSASDAGIAGAAARELAMHNPAYLGDLLKQTTDLPPELLFSALAAAGSAEAGAVASEFLTARDRSTRSMALLAVGANGELDKDQLRLLGRAAAGAGSLPARLRIPAAWVFLAKNATLETALHGIVQP